MSHSELAQPHVVTRKMFDNFWYAILRISVKGIQIVLGVFCGGVFFLLGDFTEVGCCFPWFTFLRFS